MTAGRSTCKTDLNDLDEEVSMGGTHDV